MSSWWKQRMVGFDLETTSADPFEARIVQAAVPYVGGGEPTEDWSVIVDPGVKIPDEAAAIHGITTERARAEGEPWDEAIPAILARLVLHAPDDAPIVMFVAQYDATVMDCELKRAGAPGLGVFEDMRIVDPRVIDRHLEKYRPGSRKLADTCVYYRAVLEEAHAADSDAIAACRLAYRLGQLGKVVRRTRNDIERQDFIRLTAEWERVRNDLDLLHFAQRKWCWDQCRELEEYFHRGNPNKGVPPQPWRRVAREWPIRNPPDPIDIAAAAAAEAAANAPQLDLGIPPAKSEAELTTPDWTR